MWNHDHGLYPYQAKAASVMVDKNALLAFEMGTGKTPTTIFAIERAREKWNGNPTGTVVVPASLKYQWAREVEKFSDSGAIVIDGTPKQRMDQYHAVHNTQPGYMIMSYDNFVKDWAAFKGLGRFFLVLDEATAIKSFKAKRSQHIKKVRGHYGMLFALTGTPIENGKAEEVFSIMEFVDPDVLGKFWDFEKRYIIRNQMGWIEGYKNLHFLHRKLEPSVMRATHHEPEVAKYLPKVLQRDPIRVKPTRKLLRTLNLMELMLLADLDDLAEEVQSYHNVFAAPDDERHPDGRMMAKIQVMRMLLDSPHAVRESAKKGNSQFATTVVREGLLDGIDRSPKLTAVVEYLRDFFDADPNNKAVIFTSFVQSATEISLHFATPKQNSVLFHGSLSSRSRDKAKQIFAEDPSCRLFVSTDAGGYGLDLPMANLLVNYDMPWQPGLLRQRNARIRRASSEFEYVIVQDFLVGDTIEERMYDMLAHKNALADAVVDGSGINEKGTIDSELSTLRAFMQELLSTRINRN